MIKKWIGINLILLFVAGITGWQLRVSMQNFSNENDLSMIKPGEARDQAAILPAPPVPERHSPSDFAVISEKNVFSETRTKGESANTQSATGNMPETQKPVLVGIIMTEKQKVASILTPRTRGQNTPSAQGGQNAPSAQGGQILLKRIGDTYEGYTISAIETDHIVLDNGTQKQIINLNDISQPAQRRKTTILSTRVIPIGGGVAAAANTPVSVVPGMMGLSRTAPNRSVAQPSIGGAAGQTGAAGAAGIGAIFQMLTAPAAAGQTGAQTATPQGNVRPSTQSPATNPGGVQGGSRIIRSPFGDIIRNQ